MFFYRWISNVRLYIYITDAINSIIKVSEKGKAFNRYYIGSGTLKPQREFLVEMKDIVDPSAEIGLGIY